MNTSRVRAVMYSDGGFAKAPMGSALCLSMSMPNANSREPDEVEIISWAIPRIAGGYYAFSDGPNGRELWVTEIQPTIEEMEGELLNHRPAEVRAGFSLLRENCCIDNTREVFRLLFGERLANLLADQFSQTTLTPLHYGVIVAAAYRQEKGLIRSFQRMLVSGREGLSSPSLADLECKANPEAVSVAVLAHYAEVVSSLFPKLIKRAEQLRILPSQDAVPRDVQRYMEEASKCYLYGRFIACLIVCRSALEFALRERLTALGYETDLRDLKEARNDSLANVICLARKVFPPKLRRALEPADEIRKVAKDAVHVTEPSPEKCREMFIKTRGVLSELYEDEQAQRDHA